MTTDDYYIGVLCALAVVENFDDPVMHEEIVRACGRDGLVRVARKHGDMRMSGMARSERERKERSHDD